MTTLVKETPLEERAPAKRAVRRSARLALRELPAPLASLVVIALVVVWLAEQSGGNVWSHSAYDSYSLQAMAWRDGQVTVPGQNYPWLELAVFKGDYFVSFPPLPTVPMYLLSFVFGENTPSAAAPFAYFLAGLVAVYALLRRYLPVAQATLWLVFVALGGTLVSLAAPGGIANGGVWFQAQTLAFLLTALAFLLVDGDRKLGWAVGLACIALAVGCRPFNAIYLPVLLWMLLGHLKGVKPALIPYLVAPAVVALVFGAYNYARFGNPLEFGHAYLPEITNGTEPMFMLSKVPEHFLQVLSPPWVDHGKLKFDAGGGFGVYLTNPMLVIGLGVILLRALRRRIDAVEAILFFTLVLHAALLLSHHLNGGYQYGTRYLTDLVPALVFVVARRGVRVSGPAAALMGVVIAFNVFAIVVFEAQLN